MPYDPLGEFFGPLAGDLDAAANSVAVDAKVKAADISADLDRDRSARVNAPLAGYARDRLDDDAARAGFERKFPGLKYDDFAENYRQGVVDAVKQQRFQKQLQAAREFTAQTPVLPM